LQSLREPQHPQAGATARPNGGGSTHNSDGVTYELFIDDARTLESDLPTQMTNLGGFERRLQELETRIGCGFMVASANSGVNMKVEGCGERSA
jgi:hypothetical protein